MSMKPRHSLLANIDATGVPLLIMRLVLGGTFLYMGIKKIADPITFLKQVNLYEMLPHDPSIFLNGTAIVLPWVEVICGVALLLGVYVRGAAALVVVMLGVFTPAIFLRAMGVMEAEGIGFTQVVFDCGCGKGEQIIWQKLLENSGLFVLAVLAVLSKSRRWCLAQVFERRRPVPSFCHVCGYETVRPLEGLCERCSTLPELPGGQAAAAS